jgi:hypothetical protein
VSFSRAQLALIVLVVLTTLCGSALAWAQGRASLIPPAPPKKGSPTWHFKLVGGATWYNNPFFVGAAPGTTWSTTGQASLGHDHSFRSGVFTWSGHGGALYYPEVDGLNQPIYGGAVSLAWSPGRNTKINLRQDYQRSNTRTLLALDPEGLPLPTSGLDNATSNLSFDQRLSRSWEFQAGGNYIYRRYDDPRLIGGDEVGAHARLGTHAGRDGLVFLAYVLTSSRFEGNALRSHQGLLGYQRRPPRGGLLLEVAAGVGYVESVQKAYPSGRAAIAAIGRKASIEVRYERDFGQAFGYGRPTIADVFSGIATWTPVRRLTVSAEYNYGYRRSPGDEGNTINSWIASGGFGWDVGGGVGLAARYSKEHNDTYNANVPVTGDKVSVALTYGVDWR